MYEQIVIDPPWPKKKAGKRQVRPNQSRELDYATLNVNNCFEVLDTYVFNLAAETHNVWMWAIDGFLHEAEDQMKRRGYKLHARMIWDKCNGVAPAFTIRYSHEYLLWFYRPKLMPVSTKMRGKLRTVFTEKSRQHSRKPDIAYEFIRELYPTHTRLDVFSRELRCGWDQWGDQVNYFNSND